MNKKQVGVTISRYDVTSYSYGTRVNIDVMVDNASYINMNNMNEKLTQALRFAFSGNESEIKIGGGASIDPSVDNCGFVTLEFGDGLQKVELSGYLDTNGLRKRAKEFEILAQKIDEERMEKLIGGSE